VPEKASPSTLAKEIGRELTFRFAGVFSHRLVTSVGHKLGANMHEWPAGLKEVVLAGLALLLVGFGASPVAAQEQNSRPTDAQIAQAIANLHPVPPDIRNPTRGELGLIYSTSRQAATPLGSYLRLSAFERLIAELEVSFGPEHPLVGAVHLRFADELANAQEVERAEAMLDRAQAIIAKRMEADDLFHLLVMDARQYLSYLRGDHLAQLAVAEAMQKRAGNDFADHVDAQILSRRALGWAHFELGNYAEAVRHGEQQIALIESKADGPGAQLSSAIAAQARRLVAAGRLIDAKALIEARGGTEHLDEMQQRYAIASLARARGAVFEAELAFEDAKREYETAYRIYSAADFMDATPIPSTIPADKGSHAAVRSALELKRLEVRKHNSAGMLKGGWRQDDWIELDLGKDEIVGDGPLLSTNLLERNNPFPVKGPLQAMAARFNGFSHALGLEDHELAARFWRDLVAYRERSTGKDSVRVGEALVDLAGGMMAATRPFAAREEALKAIAILKGHLAEDHPSLVRARTLAALGLSRQGRGKEAVSEIEATLEVAWQNPQGTKRDIMRLAIERDLQFQRERDIAGRVTFWEVWRDRVFKNPPGTGFVELERLAMGFVAVSQALVDNGECPPGAIVDQLFDMRKTLKEVDDLDTFRLTSGPFTYALLLTDQAIAEALTCSPQRGFTLTPFLEELRENQRYISVRKSSQALAARNERFARLLSQGESFGTDQTTTELAIEFAADAAYTANFQITRARGLEEAATSDDRLARVFASEGAGFDVRYGLETQLDVLWRASRVDFARGPVDENDFEENFYRRQQFDDAFKAAQLLRIDGNSQTLALASARAAAPNLQLRETVARYQTLSAELFRELSISTEPTERLQDLQNRHEALDTTIREQFPEYYDFAAPRPLSIFDARNVLGDNEGLLTIITVGEDVYVFAVSKTNGETWHKVTGGAPRVSDLVSTLRCEVDPIECGSEAVVQTRGGAGSGGQARPEAQIEGWEGFSFDRNAAYELYETLIAPVSHVFDDRFEMFRTDRLFVVTSGAISALPLSLLLTEKPQDNGYDTMGRVFLDAPWLSNRFDINYLPAVSDLRGTQQVLGQTSGFIGYGDPVLGPPKENATKGSRGEELFGTVRGSNGQPLADPAALLKLDSLLGAEQELAAVAGLFPEGSRLITKTAATEHAIKRDDAIAGAEVILFSTHGVLADPSLGTAEPGLVMTPPDAPSDLDDGLLSASEAAALDFTAELLILSACNTATEGSFSGADSLSGLARSFIFAGARSVYASHWHVSDNITKELIFIAVEIALREPELTRSEALGKAMRAIRSGAYEDGTLVKGWTPDWAHPSAWAPFVAIVTREQQEEGEGK
jgi:CHAT domain-containing protein